MALSLPESTVDAWTAISLAQQGSDWIWSPTTVAGGTFEGAHPGDVSTVFAGRLIVIENKGVEDGRQINWGKNPRQRLFLRGVEERGLALLRRLGMDQLTPPRGWVFYGLPLIPGVVDGRAWREFPSRHHLVCPHNLDLWRVGRRSTSLGVLARHLRIEERHLHAPVPRSYWAASEITLDALRHRASLGLVGLPLGGDPLGTLLRLAQAVQALLAEAEDDEEFEFQNLDLSSESPAEALLVLGSQLSSISQNVMLAIV